MINSVEAISFPFQCFPIWIRIKQRSDSQVGEVDAIQLPVELHLDEEDEQKCAEESKRRNRSVDKKQVK